MFVIPSFITLIGGTVLTTSMVNPQTMYSTPYKEVIEYINGFRGLDVTIINHHGVSMVVESNPPAHGRYNDYFVIRRRIIIESGAYFSFVNGLNRFTIGDEYTTDTVIRLKQALENHNTDSRYPSTFEVYLDTLIKIDDIRKTGGSLYSEESDLVVSILGNSQRLLHPRSREYQKKVRINNNTTLHDSKDLLYKVEIIDNTGSFGVRFLKIASDVYSITPKCDAGRREGVYVTKNQPSEGMISYNEVEEKFYTIEEAEKELQLCRTFEMAKYSDDDRKIQHKKELEVLEHENSKEKLKLAKEKTVSEIVKGNFSLIMALVTGLAGIYKLIVTIATTAATAAGKK